MMYAWNNWVVCQAHHHTKSETLTLDITKNYRHNSSALFSKHQDNFVTTITKHNNMKTLKSGSLNKIQCYRRNITKQ